MHTDTIDTTEGLDLTIPAMRAWNATERAAARMMSRKQARFLVDTYYQTQERRIASAAQSREATQADEPCIILDAIFNEQALVEKRIEQALGAYTMGQPLGKWLRSIWGIGPVISAGLIAHTDVGDKPYAASLWSYAGLNPDVVWQSGQVRPWNAKLKVLCFKISGSFVMGSGGDKSVYGRLYAQRKRWEVEKNESGGNADAARLALASKNYSRETVAKDAYEHGKLPPGHVDMRARRYVVKMFLSHMHEVGYWLANGELPPAPFAISVLGHDATSYIPPPNTFLLEGYPADRVVPAYQEPGAIKDHKQYRVASQPPIVKEVFVQPTD